MKTIYSKKFPDKIAGFKMSEEECRGHIEENNGFCLSCGKVTWGGCEPDAQDYECESCGESKVFGTEELLMMGKIAVTEENED